MIQRSRVLAWLAVVAALGLVTVSITGVVRGYGLEGEERMIGRMAFAWLSLIMLGAALIFLRGCPPRRVPPRICQHCGYDLRKIMSRRCPECGGAAPLVGPPTNVNERIVAALHGRNIDDLEPRFREETNAASAEEPAAPAADWSAQVERHREAMRRLRERPGKG